MHDRQGADRGVAADVGGLEGVEGDHVPVCHRIGARRAPDKRQGQRGEPALQGRRPPGADACRAGWPMNCAVGVGGVHVILPLTIEGGHTVDGMAVRGRLRTRDAWGSGAARS